MLEEEVAEDSFWWTEKDKEQTSQELHFLKQFDQATNEYRDIRWMYFRREVLDKYRNSEFCDVDREHISFLEDDKKTPDSTVNFICRNFANIHGIVLMVQALDYISIPPRQRPHWQKHEILESQIQFE